MRRKQQQQPAAKLWPKVVLKKWLNMSGKNSSADFSADDFDSEDAGEDERRPVPFRRAPVHSDDHKHSKCDENDIPAGVDEERKERPTQIAGGGSRADDDEVNLECVSYKLRRRNSETLRTQYIESKELRICTGTWNVGGKVPQDDLDISQWLSTDHEPADIYVVGIQEIVPLNAGNVFGAEDSRPVRTWENLIRDTLNKLRPPVKPRYKCHSDPPSPSRFTPSEDAVAATVDMLLSESDSDIDDTHHRVEPAAQEPMINSSNLGRRLDRSRRLSLTEDQQNQLMECSSAVLSRQKTLAKSLSRSERIGLVWPEQPLDLLTKQKLAASASFKSSPSSSLRSFKKYASFGPTGPAQPEIKRPPFVRIASKQMVGIFLSVWVRRNLRKHIQNLKISTVGVGAMGYIGNKGSVSVSLSVYQTLFCFVCSHLSSGEQGGDVLKRNADVQEIHRRTLFNGVASTGLPKTIYDHERIMWLGDLNYRIDLPYDKVHELVNMEDWHELSEKDQLKRELRKGRAFDGWNEGVLLFPPTYKYKVNSEKYISDDHKSSRRSPAWCDRVLWFGKGMKLLSYKRAELKLSDHRPVTATFLAEVEAFCHKKLQKALTLTDAEIEQGGVIPEDLDFRFTMMTGNDVSEWIQR